MLAFFDAADAFLARHDAVILAASAALLVVYPFAVRWLGRRSWRRRRRGLPHWHPPRPWEGDVEA